MEEESQRRLREKRKEIREKNAETSFFGRDLHEFYSLIAQQPGDPFNAT
jgi:hypothetical protein